MLNYLKAKRGKISFKERYAYRLTTLWQSDFALKHADRVVLSTTEDRDYLIHGLNIPEERVTLVNGGVSSTFLSCSNGASHRAGILFFATWIERKGIRDVVAVFSRLARSLPKFRITVAGCGTAAEAVLADFPEDCRSAIRVIPRIEGEDSLLEEYRSHSIFFAPSVFEGQLLTMLEAAAAGLVPVCTDTCGMKDFIRSGENGLLASVGDADGLFDAVIRLALNAELTARLAVAAQDDARHFTWKRSSEQFLSAVGALI
jgi:glycosyltransferase involved in cell wall biosynthesis